MERKLPSSLPGRAQNDGQDVAQGEDLEELLRDVLSAFGVFEAQVEPVLGESLGDAVPCAQFALVARAKLVESHVQSSFYIKCIFINFSAILTHLLMRLARVLAYNSLLLSVMQ